MRACLVPVLSFALVLQGAFAASFERRSPAMSEPCPLSAAQRVDSDAMVLNHVVDGKEIKARRSDRSYSFFDAKANSDGSGRHLAARGSDMSHQATPLVHVVNGGKGRNARRSDAHASSELIGSKAKTNDDGEVEGERPHYGFGLSRVMGDGAVNKRRSEAQASSDLINSQANINHHGGHGDDKHTRRAEPQVLADFPSQGD